MCVHWGNINFGTDGNDVFMVIYGYGSRGYMCMMCMGESQSKSKFTTET